MPFRFFALSLFCLFALSLFLPFPLSSQALPTYPLPLGREIKPADVYFLRATSTRIVEVVSNADPKKPMFLQLDTTTVNVIAKCEVAAVTEDGQEARKIVTIRHAELVKGGETKDILNTGTALNVEFSDSGAVFLMNGRPIDPGVAGLLSTVIQAEGGKRTGDIMNADHDVAVGESWKLDTAAFVRSMGITSPPTTARVSGTITFTRIDDVMDRKIGTVTMKTTCTNLFPEIDGLVPNTSKLDASITVRVPIDVRYPATHVTSTSTLTADFGSGATSTAVTVRLLDDRQFDR